MRCCNNGVVRFTPKKAQPATGLHIFSGEKILALAFYALFVAPFSRKSTPPRDAGAAVPRKMETGER